jgi:proteasome assembly chaperone (PAC2) family protein
MCDARAVTQTGPLLLEPDRADLSDSLLVLAFSGWSDGGDAATTALRHLLAELPVSPYAQIDTEDFLDFTVARPQVRLASSGEREVVWPTHEFHSMQHEGDAPDLIVGLGIEPHLRWRSYAEAVIELVRAANCRRVFMLGAYLDEVIYSQPVDVTGTASDAQTAAELGLSMSGYEGPTGIVGVLSHALRRAGVASVSLWARIPHYVPNRPNARGALALLLALQTHTGLRVELSTLTSDASEFDETVSQLISNDPELSAYVRELKRRAFTQ